MIEIPMNNRVRNFEGEVESAIRIVLEGLSKKDEGRVYLRPTEPGDTWFHDDVAAEVARRFKERGYFAHYERNLIHGWTYALEITRYHTNKDI